MKKQQPRRHDLTLSLALIAGGVAMILLYCFPLVYFLPIAPEAISLRGGYAYVAPVGQSKILRILLTTGSDSDEAKTASTLELYEDDQRIGRAHTQHVEIVGKGAGRFSHWGDDIIFSASDNTSPLTNGRVYAVSQRVSLPGWLGLILLLFGTGNLCRRRCASGSPGGTSEQSENLIARLHCLACQCQPARLLFWVMSLTLAVYTNFVVIRLFPGSVLGPDSRTYVGWDLLRTLGYPAFLEAYQWFFADWHSLPFIQLNLLVVATIALAYGLARVTGSYLVAWLYMGIVANAGGMLLSSLEVLTEALFAAMIMIHLALMYWLFIDGRRLIALAAGIALAAAILVKSVGVVFLGPLLLLLIALSQSRRLLILAILPALAAWLAPGTYNYFRHGFFESSLMGGIALSGHIAWTISEEPNDGGSDDARRVAAQLAPVLMKRPKEYANLDEYINYTANEYNTLVWANMVPLLTKQHADACRDDTCTWLVCTRCWPELNRTMFTLAVSAIKRNPASYTKHVLAHYYGLWHFTFLYPEVFSDGVATRAALVAADYSDNPSIYGAPRVSLSPDQRAAQLLGIKDSVGHQLYDLATLHGIWTNAFVRAVLEWPPFLIGLGLVACAYIFGLSKRSPATQAFCYTALVVNAYYLGQALAQPALIRYAIVMQGAVGALLCLGGFLFFRGITETITARRTITQPQAES
jgi:hypothetical protein